MGWPDIHWLARDEGGLVAASVRVLDRIFEYAFEA